MSKPLYRKNIETLANRAGHEPGQLIDHLKRRAREIAEQATDCFQPDEIAEYERTGTIRGGRVEHAAGCASCATLIDSSHLDEPKAPIVPIGVGAQHEPIADPALEIPSRALADRLWSYRTIGAAAAVLALGIVTARISQRRTSSAPREVLLTFRAGQGTESVSIPVKAQGDRLSSDSFVRVAAATTVAEGTAQSDKNSMDKGQGFVNVGMTHEELQTVSSAIATAYNEQGEVEVPSIPTPEQHKEVLNALVHSFEKTNVRAVSMLNGEVGLYRNENCVAIVKPADALRMTAEYTKILRTTNGDTKALDNQLKNISFTVVAAGDRQISLPQK